MVGARPEQGRRLEKLHERALLKEFADYVPPVYKPVATYPPGGAVTRSGE